MRRSWLPRVRLLSANLALLIAGLVLAAAAAVSANAAGVVGPHNRQSAANLQRSDLRVVTGPKSTPPLTPGGAKTESVASCPAGMHVLGGGYKVVGGPFAADGIVVVDNGPTASGDGWRFAAVQFPATFAQSGYQFEAQAVCALVTP